MAKRKPGAHQKRPSGKRLPTCAREKCRKRVKRSKSKFCSVRCSSLARQGKSDNPDIKGIIRGAYSVGGTDAEAAKAAGMSLRGLLYMFEANPELAEIRDHAKAIADDHVTRNLYGQTKRNVIACIFWLKNRRPDLWKDRKDLSVSGVSLADLVNATPEAPGHRKG